ncbi:hypothetical protein DPMN_051326 [Dreissena polymorpha]|uniref:Uncharacterized protein n=1 Tax=Dreissena polymorpha TaxID=45954 RepID=A0A9D4CJ53_DREPO|nr:hypothetical protein DPMN_051326 [Dreissena polymorpha]
MRRPTHCSCNATENADEMTSAHGSRGSVSPAININGSVERRSKMRLSNFPSVSQGSASFGVSHLSEEKYSFDLARWR